MIDDFGQFPVTYTSADVPVIDAKINGKSVHLIIDTGSAISTLTPGAAAELHLTDLKPTPLVMFGLGGVQRNLPSTYRDISIQDVTIKNTLFLVTSAAAKTQVDQRGVDGTLGNNALTPFDIDFDFPENRVTLYVPRNCQPDTSPPPWKTPDPGTIFLESVQMESYFPITLNDVRINAMVDTGTTVTTVSGNMLAKDRIWPTAVSDRFPGHVLVYGSDAPIVRFGEFQKIEIGQELSAKPVLAISEGKSGLNTALIGMNYLRKHRVFIANSVWMIYFGRPSQSIQ